VHDRQDNGVGRASVRAKAMAKAETTPKKTRRIEYAPVNHPQGPVVRKSIHSVTRTLCPRPWPPSRSPIQS
jgi:hypothetical protein